VERFNLKKLNEVDVKEQYHIEISNGFEALEHLDTEVDINRAWETIRENIKISAKQSLVVINYIFRLCKLLLFITLFFPLHISTSAGHLQVFYIHFTLKMTR
jgi:hypothetical protein